MSEAIYICDSESLDEGGKGIRFPVTVAGDDLTACVVRYGQEPRAYLNRCAHLPMELDWTEGEFFESSGLYLMCATHGALYEPDTGQCAGGPCRGGRLHAINVIEREKKIFWEPDDYVRPARA
ncbi:MAG: Rieske 2Fe-2S domain-containing protein [Sulfuritalea sp.]|nr:Rieske 2Fe-2S domain-containing protein [Sulfuritalea sp.]